MRRGCSFLLVLMLSLASVTLAGQPYQTAKLLEIQKKISTIPRSYIWDTLVTYSETETYELRIRPERPDLRDPLHPDNPAVFSAYRMEDRRAY
jgi:hypothetical protein